MLLPIRILEAARKHGIKDDQIRFVISHCGLAFEQPSPDDPTEPDRWLLLGDDKSGLPLEILAVEDAEGDLVVIHAMKMRRRLSASVRGGSTVANRPVKLKGGRFLDRALIEKLSSEAERGYDLSKAKRVILREGRPARGEPTGESPQVASRIPEAVYHAARHRAANEGLTVSEVIRALLTDYARGRVLARVRRSAKPPAGRSSDSDLTATGTDDRVRRRTLRGPKKGAMYSRRTSPNVGGRKKPGL